MTTSRTLGPDAAGTRVAVSGGRIESIARGAARADETASWIERGRVNAHTHIYSGLAPFGMPEPETPPADFPEILERVWWRLDRALDAASLRASARYYVAESLRLGTTTLIDHHESPAFIEGSLDVIADACEALGIRAVLCFGATERNGGREEARRGLGECERFVRANRRPLVRGVVGLHASFTVTDETIREAASLCRTLDTVMHVHLAEDVCDITDARARGYDDPLERLLALGALPRGSIVAHAVHLGPDAIARLDDAGVWIVQNPRSNHGNRVGYPRALAKSARVALGTDGYPSDLAAEASALAVRAREHGDDAGAVARRLRAGHDLVGERFGGRFTLEAGGAADVARFVPRDPGAGNTTPIRSGIARDVVVGGRTVVAEGALVTGDWATIRAEAEKEAPRLWRRMRAVGPTPGTPGSETERGSTRP